MEVKDILEQIQYNRGRFAREAVLAAIEKREEITPHLLQILEETMGRAHEIAEDPSYMSHLYAMHLLAQFRERRAYPLIARLYSIPGSAVDEISGDFITSGLGSVLASVSGGDPSLIKGLIENREAFVWARVGALKAIPAMVSAGELSREEGLTYFQELLRGKLEREPLEDVANILDALIEFAIDLYPEEIYEDIRKALEDELLVPEYMVLEDVDRGLRRGKEETLRVLPEKHSLITDTVQEMCWWACFEEDYRERCAQRDRSVALDVPDLPGIPPESLDGTASSAIYGAFPGLEEEDPMSYGAVEPIIRDAPKIGRNDPCRCGSGKKYKKCCGKGAP